jgi:hypothetical protein
VIRIACAAPSPDLAQRVQARLKAHVLITLDVELVRELPANAEPVLDRRTPGGVR